MIHSLLILSSCSGEEVVCVVKGELDFFKLVSLICVYFVLFWGYAPNARDTEGKL